MRTNTTCPQGRLTLLTSLSAALLLSTQGVGSAASFVYTTGELENPANWVDQADSSTGVRPGTGDTGLISFTGTRNVGNATTGAEGGVNNAGNTIAGFDDATINHTSGTLSGAFNWANAGSTYNLQGGTIRSTTNFNANSGSIFNLSSGTLSVNGDLIVNSTTGGINVSGTATISTDGQFDLRLNQTGASFSIDPNWTGSFIGPNEANLAAWSFELVNSAAGDNGSTANSGTRFIDVGGTQITAANFGDFFQTTALVDGGTSLSLIPEPSIALLGGLGLLGLLRRRRD